MKRTFAAVIFVLLTVTTPARAANVAVESLFLTFPDGWQEIGNLSIDTSLPDPISPQPIPQYTALSLVPLSVPPFSLNDTTVYHNGLPVPLAGIGFPLPLQLVRLHSFIS
jgi:hypothetical protein